jgi:hypothetical protein
VNIDDDAVAERVWAALANNCWTYETGETVRCGYRAAGRLVAEMRGRGDYMDWYCCVEARQTGVVSAEIEKAMAKRGWTWKRWTLDQVLK